MNPILNEILQTVVHAFVPVIMAAGTAAVVAIREWAKGQTRSTQSRTSSNCLENLTRVVDMVVAELHQTVAPALRDNNGWLTPEGADQLRKMALEKVKAIYGPDGLARMSRDLQTTLESTNLIIQARIEQSVLNLKAVSTQNNGNLPVFGGMTPSEKKAAEHTTLSTGYVQVEHVSALPPSEPPVPQLDPTDLTRS